MDKKVALVEKYPSTIPYSSYFPFDFDQHALMPEKKDKVLKRDITLDIDSVKEEYDYLILVGAESARFVGGIGSVTDYQGFLMENKFLPLMNPLAVKMKPSIADSFDVAINDIIQTIEGTLIRKDINSFDVKGIRTKKEAIDYINFISDTDIKVIAVDTETTGFYPRDGYVLGISISHTKEQGVYIESDIIDEEVVNLLQKVFDTKTIIFHNYKFDIAFLSYHFGLTLPSWDTNRWEDTMLMHYVLDETEGSHGLKQLAIKYTELGDYDRDLDLFKKTYCRQHKIKQDDFTYDLIPFETIAPYAALDTAATLELYFIFKDAIESNKKLSLVYKRLLKEGSEFLFKVQDNGIPLDITRINSYIDEVNHEIIQLTEKLYDFEEIKKLESVQNKPFNVNSPKQKSDLFFNYLNLPVIALTDTGAPSTNAEVIEELAPLHPLPRLVNDIMKLKKIKSTYLEKFKAGIDCDSRIRTNFNLHTVSSGRLSSSGKFNAQQLPRKDKRPKKCIKARDGFKIVSQDLKTAEMYVAAVLSGDKVLQQIFKDGVDYHGAMAVTKFGLPCSPDEVSILYPDDRQAAKTISFEILYKLNYEEEALEKFTTLKKWLKSKEKEIRKNKFLYSFFGRKRRLEDVTSPNRKEAMHIIRSGINFLVQSTASDINLLAGIDMQKWIEENGYSSKMIIFGLVHDSILAEVADDVIDIYTKKLAEFTQKNRMGMSIPGSPIGLDLEIGQDYSFENEAA